MLCHTRLEEPRVNQTLLFVYKFFSVYSSCLRTESWKVFRHLEEDATKSGKTLFHCPDFM